VDLRRDYSQGWRLNQSSQNHTGKIARAAGSMSVAVLLSRVLGLVREQVLAALFGAGYSIDAFVVAFRIPNLLRDLFAEGALSTAFVTVFTQHDQKLGPERTWRLANNVIAFLALLVGGISLLGMFFSPQLVDLMAPDFGLVPGKLQLTWTMTRIMFPFLLLVSLAAVVMGILNTKEKFFIPALSSSFFNLGSILVGVGLAVLLPRFGFSAIVGMAWGTLAGGLFQLLIQIPQLRRVGFRFNYAYRLVHLPQGLFGVALSVATLPMVSRFAAHRNIPAMKEAFSSSLSLAMLLALPAAAGLIALANPICAVIFQHGRFSTWDTHQTAAAVVLYSLGLFAFAAVKIIVPVFYALDDTKIPVMGSFITVAFNILIINFTINALGHRAIALSTSLSMMVNLLFLASMLYRKVEGYAVRDLLTTLVKVTGAAAIMGVTVWGFYSVATVWLGKSLFKEMLALGGSIFLGMALYLALIYPLNIPEFQILLGGLKARWGRSRTG
jgi:putative peptidoglycan lipid II flippase